MYNIVKNNQQLLSLLLKQLRDQSMTHEAIITRCLRGDALAQKALVGSYLNYVKSICFRYKANDMHMDELVNDCFLKIFNGLASYDLSKEFKPWVRKITIHTCIDYYRKKKCIDTNADIDEVVYEDQGHNILSELAGQEILALIEKLPTSYRLVFTLYVIDGYSHKEIAEMLGIKEGTSKSNLQDARIKLQEMVKYEYAVLYKLYSIKNRSHANG